MDLTLQRTSGVQRKRLIICKWHLALQAGRRRQLQRLQHGHIRPAGVPEVHVLELHAARTVVLTTQTCVFIVLLLLTDRPAWELIVKVGTVS